MSEYAADGKNVRKEGLRDDSIIDAGLYITSTD